MYYRRKHGNTEVTVEILLNQKANDPERPIHGLAVWEPKPERGRQLVRFHEPTRSFVTDEEFRRLEEARGKRRYVRLSASRPDFMH